MARVNPKSSDAATRWSLLSSTSATWYYQFYPLVRKPHIHRNHFRPLSKAIQLAPVRSRPWISSGFLPYFRSDALFEQGFGRTQSRRCAQTRTQDTKGAAKGDSDRKSVV